MAATMGMARPGSCRADTKVARPSGKLWMAMARAVNTPMRSNRAVGAGEASMASASFTSWGFSAEGISLSMMAMSSMPPKNAPTVAQLPARVPNWAASEAWALERISAHGDIHHDARGKAQGNREEFSWLVWRLRNATRLPMPVLRPPTG